MLSLITTCKNREDFVKKVIGSWVAQECINEIIIVDYGSDIPLRESLDGLLTPQCYIIQASSSLPWKKGLATNIGLHFTTSKFVMITDCDVGFKSIDFFLRSVANGYVDFYRGSFSSGTSSGLLLAKRSDLINIGGYNEWIEGWGMDDTDICARLHDAGKSSDIFTPDCFFEYYQPMAIKNHNAKKLGSIFYGDQIELAGDPKFTSFRNFIYCKFFPQTSRNFLNFKYESITSHIYDANIIDYDNMANQFSHKVEFANTVAIALFKAGYDLDRIKQDNMQSLLNVFPS